MAQKVRVIPATINRTTSAPIDARVKRKVAGYARVSTELEEQQSSYEAQVLFREGGGSLSRCQAGDRARGYPLL